MFLRVWVELGLAVKGKGGREGGRKCYTVWCGKVWYSTAENDVWYGRGEDRIEQIAQSVCTARA